MNSTPGCPSVHVDHNTVVVAPTDELDLATVPALRAALRDALAAGCAVVRVDLAAVTFLDSTALAALVETWRDATGRGMRFEVVHPAVNVRRVLEITNLDHLVAD
jgi:anti-sigma B factor antagonist